MPEYTQTGFRVAAARKARRTRVCWWRVSRHRVTSVRVRHSGEFRNERVAQQVRHCAKKPLWMYGAVIAGETLLSL